MSTSCVCSICLSDFVDPVCTPCGHVYCLKCIAQATSIQRNEGSTSTIAPCPTCRKLFSVGDDPLPRDFNDYSGYPLRRLYVNGLRVNFEEKVKRLEERITSLEWENHRLRMKHLLLPPRYMHQQSERNSRSVPWLARTPRTGSGSLSWVPREERNASRMRWLANTFIFGLMILAGSIAGLALYDAFGRYTRSVLDSLISV
ncbi:uncharacterized protein EV420DRAFT_1635898 [Desarmillaria tabescens]|uniref:RING-type domain-containing protein n=1 Tax=Armillaria tabescens TaxID=1929756 RepID=A0AA39TYM0_ARMTA|nr:uncharacterized protein EV420DRAFT_1635898 [Desarmillaria tabescens]KAK0466859.1 hypothetical protein EV420DRAFT_1635898 [Desarmillaria tabescens]